MGLQTYRAKRTFARTPEPSGEQESVGNGRSFVVQEHHARRLHYDLRLELDGVLKSWAVPKGPSLNPGQTVLAVEVEDHPLAYRSFEGVIPPGQYGSGTVMVWDEGVWDPAGDPRQGLRRGKLKFTLRGERLTGDWMLVRMKQEKGSQTNWLLRKMDDAAASRTVDVVAKHRTSVRTGRSVEQIAAHEPSAKRRKPNPGSAKGQVEPARLPEAREDKMPRDLRPQLATPAETAPSGDDWLHEIKFDGYRILAYVERRKARLLTRGGYDWTDRFGEIASALEQLRLESAILDGEVVAETTDGRISFQQLQNHLRHRGRAALVLYVFDLLYWDGFDLTRSPLVERKKALEAVLQDLPGGAARRVRYSGHIRGDGPRVIEEACRRGLEGVISKRITSRYMQRRSHDWLKAKCVQRQEFVIVGYTKPGGTRVGFGSLLLATREEDTWCYRGNVGTGFDDRLLRDLHQQLRGLRCETPPVQNLPAARSRGVHWVRPELVAEVQFTEWTTDGHLRHPVFMGIREDKVPTEISRELPRPVAEAAAPPARSEQGQPAAPDRRGKGKVTVEGVVLTHPDRELYPEQGVTKHQLAEYYLEVADRVLPYVANRPLALVRCPEGRGGKCFFQKHATPSLPDAIQLVNVAEEGEEAAPHLQIKNPAGLVALAQLGVLEIHIWGSRSDRVERPDRMVFDLDPGPNVEYAAVIDGAREVRRLLEVLGLESFVMLTGGKGIHVVVPLQRHHGWDEIKPFARSIAQFMERMDPKRYVSVMSKARRKGRIFVDYLRNGRGATAIAPYSTRARSGAPVSAPLGWDELSVDRAPNHYKMNNIRQRLEGLSQEPWAGYEAARGRITRRRHDELNRILKG
jgi:bifunctional non-homologous end joining protein LigD